MSRIMVDLAKVDTTEVAEQTGVPTEHVERVIGRIVMNHNNNKRQVIPPPPNGGICLNAAERKYGVLHSTISRWVSKGYIPIVERRRNWLYIDEKALVVVIENYFVNPGKGKKIIRERIKKQL